MNFTIRPALLHDQPDLLRLSTSLSAQGFLTLPSTKKELEELLRISQKSFDQKLENPDQAKYLFVLESEKVIGCSLLLARHGDPKSPHLYFAVDENKKTLQLVCENEGRTELGGLIIDPVYRGHPEKLGKKLSYVRLFYLSQHPKFFKENIVAELLPPFNSDGTSPLWEVLGKKLTGMSYREADERSRYDKKFVQDYFQKEISLDSLPSEARAILGVPGPETKPVAKILSAVGFRYLHQIDPFDGGPHYGATQGDIRYDLVRQALFEKTEVQYL